MKGKKEVGAVQIGIYGLGNFAAQLSWTMVSTYLVIFYTDVFGLAASSVAMLMLIAKVWDGMIRLWAQSWIRVIQNGENIDHLF